jgi:hypothetical protein
MDLLGHGERREHPFVGPDDFPAPFRVDRQDYWFRFNLGIQAHLVGESLMGWMVRDLMRGIDLLLSRSTVDPDRLILIGSVAGGGDVAAVTAALDSRVSAVIPFGFGPGREVRSEGPNKPREEQFNFAGTGSWESTRNLRLSARDGFTPWLILSAVAPRHLVYAHEFGFDTASDPVWERLQKVYALHGVPDRLAFAHGRGRVSGHPPFNTHCNNVGRHHQEQLYPILERWFDLPRPESRDLAGLTQEELLCLANGVPEEFEARPAYRLAADLGATGLTRVRQELTRLSPGQRRERLRTCLQRTLGDIAPGVDLSVDSRRVRRVGGGTRERVVLLPEPGIAIGLALLVPHQRRTGRPPVVIGFTQGGSRALRRGRKRLLTEIFAGGAAVCLADLRGTASTRHGDSARGRTSLASAVASSELMLGQTAVGAKLRDLRSVLRYLRSRQDLDGRRCALWGDSLADSNPPQTALQVPFDAEPFPILAEPLGGFLALLGALFEPGIAAVYLCGGLTGFASVLESPYCYVPHDVIVPAILKVGDLPDLAASLAPAPLRAADLVDGLNRRVAREDAMVAYEVTRSAYEAAGAADSFVLDTPSAPPQETAGWLLDRLRAV